MKEIIIVYDEDNKNYDIGKFFEELANRIFKSLRYKVSSNVQYTGMEFDLECIHQDRTNEKVLVECKAKQSLSSKDITTFAFNTQYKKMDFGYFLYTRSFEKQVAGLINEIKEDKRYKNLYFWNSNKIIELLVASNAIQKFEVQPEKYRITKLILMYSFKGIYYIPLISNSTMPEKYAIINALNNNSIISDDVNSFARKYIKEIENLALIDLNKGDYQHPKEQKDLETIAEIQQSISWDDYKPASTKFFVGRKTIRDQLLKFIMNVYENKNQTKVFYIDGKSGWGKSSLLNELKGKTTNKFYRNKLFSIMIDSRSANSSNFVALAFKLLLDKAVLSKFIPKKFKEIHISSAYDIINTGIVLELVEWLRKNDKMIVIVFDQFEDIFRREELFESFYKFLTDVKNNSSNIIVGFSWKSEVNIPIEHKSYHLWQQTKEFAKKLTLHEFDFNECNSIVRQLQKDIDVKLESDFRNKIINNSQGFPWLVKKLCIHIKKQFNQKVDIQTLYEQDFNVESLFKDDLEGLTSKEVTALNYIAKRASDNEAFDITELDDMLDSNTIDKLLDKRYIIKSGTKYNIYWDIFRDYLVNKEVPKIGETYLIRQNISSILEAFLCFKTTNKLTISESMDKLERGKGTTLNILRQLRNFGLIEYKNSFYEPKDKIKNINEKTFKNYITNKLNKHTFVIELKKIESKLITYDDVIKIIEKKIIGKKYAKKSLLSYAQIFLNCIEYCEIDLNIDPKTLKSVQDSFSFTPQSNPSDLIDFFFSIKDGQEITSSNKNDKFLYDLKSLELLIHNKRIVTLTNKGKIACNKKDISIIINNALKTDKIKVAFGKYSENPVISSKDFKILVSELLESINNKTYKSQTARRLFLWAKFIFDDRK
jgi:hypothetical protein